MRRLIAAAGTILVAGSAAAVLSTASASAATTGMPVLIGSFHLTKTDSDGVTTSADLDCFRGVNVYGDTYIGGNGTVTDPVEACQELDAVDGDFSKLDVHPTWMISMLYAPITASATGWWTGVNPDDWSQTYINGSDLAKHTGDVFAF